MVYFLALALRSTLETFATPQSGDRALPMQLLESEDLRAVIGYADSYCGSVMGCQFTVFRCILGDCTTADGENLVAIFSKGFGPAFDFVYCSGMVVVFFGLFNVITAIFVEATLKGLERERGADQVREIARVQLRGREDEGTGCSFRASRQRTEARAESALHEIHGFLPHPHGTVL